jgi:EpsD family peptidyl-prolyl cis-trans isomerase
MTCCNAKYRAASTTPWGLALVVGTLALSACSPAGSSQDVAKGNGFSISGGELDQALKDLPAVPPAMRQTVRRNVLSRLVQQKLLANAAVTESLDRDPRVLADIEAAKRAVLARAYAQKLTAAVHAPSDRDIKNFYDQHPEAFARRVSVEMDEVILAGPEAAANKFARALDRGRPVARWGAHAAAEGVQVTASHAVTTTDKLPATLAQKIGEVPPGGFVIFRVEEGVVYARVLAQTPAPLDLESATPIIREGLQTMGRDQLLNKEIERLRAKAAITYPDPALAPVAGKP